MPASHSALPPASRAGSLQGPSSAPPAVPWFGWYGDDFTGATDTLAVLAQAGLRSMLFMGVPTPEALAAAGPLDAVGIAGAARAMAPEAMRAELAPVGRFFRHLSPPVVHYKVCSTFDSAPQVGNMACAIDALHPAVDHPWVPIVGGQPNLGRYCVFSHLFAAAGSGGLVHRIDRHPTMRQHPVTPMGEADLRQHLARQGLQGITALHYPVYEAGDDAVDAALQALLGQGNAKAPVAAQMAAQRASASAHQQHADAISMAIRPSARSEAAAGRPTSEPSMGERGSVGSHHGTGTGPAEPIPTLLDLASPSHLATVGRLLWTQAQHARLLAVGSSAVAQALVAHWAAAGRTAPSALLPSAPLSPAQGPVFAWAGSLSPLTAQQVEAATDYHRIPVDAARLTGDAGYAQALCLAICQTLQAGRHVLAHTGPAGAPLLPGHEVRSAAQAGSEEHAPSVAQASADLIARVVQTRAEQGTPLRRIGIAGGDTSSHAVQALGLWGLSYQTTLAPGVTLSRAHSPCPARHGMELMLKGGQMGGVDLFKRLLGC